MRVLIADDNPDATEMLAILVRAWGYEPLQVHDGLHALRELQANEAPTLALIDWVMPEMNGIDLCREIRKDVVRPYTYIFLVTGRGGKQQMLNGLNAGADDFLLKPVEAEELRARLATGKRILDLQTQLLATQQLLREQATRDALTGLWNRATILDILNRELARGRRENQPVGIIMADIDHFKEINDTHGHWIGDQVLRHTAERILDVVRPYDTAGRYGGDEFLVVLPGCDTPAALALAERLRRSVAADPIQGNGHPVSITLSLGAAAWDAKASTQELFQLADGALYRAKEAGRNRAMAAPAPGDSSEPTQP